MGLIRSHLKTKNIPHKCEYPMSLVLIHTRIHFRLLAESKHNSDITYYESKEQKFGSVNEINIQDLRDLETTYPPKTLSH